MGDVKVRVANGLWTIRASDFTSTIKLIAIKQKGHTYNQSANERRISASRDLAKCLEDKECIPQAPPHPKSEPHNSKDHPQVYIRGFCSEIQNTWEETCTALYSYYLS
jgi:hypothetical protein